MKEEHKRLLAPGIQTHGVEQVVRSDDNLKKQQHHKCEELPAEYCIGFMNGATQSPMQVTEGLDTQGVNSRMHFCFCNNNTIIVQQIYLKQF